MNLVKGLFTTAVEEEVLLTGGGDGVIKIWSINSLSGDGLVLLEKFKNPGFNVLSMVDSGRFLYAGLSNGVAHIYNLTSRQLVHKLSIPYNDVTSIQTLSGVALCGTSLGWVKVGPNYLKSGSCTNVLEI
jgi:di- and tripeptidase